MQKIVNMAFGPGKAFVLWMDEGPEKGKAAKYRTCSEKLPGNLMGHLHGRGCHLNRLHSVAIGKQGDFVMSYELTKGGGDALWDLPHHNRMHHLLQDVDRDKRDTIRVAIGSGPDDFWIKTDHSMHCPNANCSLTDEVEDMSRGDVVMVALGMEGCGLILSKGDGLLDHLRVPSQYPSLLKDLKKHGKADGKERVILSVSLNPFTKDEYFIAFEGGLFCYNSEALGGHCEPLAATSKHFARRGKDMAVALTDKEIGRGKAFDDLMYEWEVNKVQGMYSNDDFEEWETPRVAKRRAGRKSGRRHSWNL